LVDGFLALYLLEGMEIADGMWGEEVADDTEQGTFAAAGLTDEGDEFAWGHGWVNQHPEGSADHVMGRLFVAGIEEVKEGRAELAGAGGLVVALDAEGATKSGVVIQQFTGGDIEHAIAEWDEVGVGIKSLVIKADLQV
jgi:hypothetical protein